MYPSKPSSNVPSRGFPTRSGAGGQKRRSSSRDKAAGRGEVLIRELQDHGDRKITAPLQKVPRIIEFVDELPKTISGKIRRKAIRADDENR